MRPTTARCSQSDVGSTLMDTDTFGLPGAGVRSEYMRRYSDACVRSPSSRKTGSALVLCPSSSVPRRTTAQATTGNQFSSAMVRFLVSLSNSTCCTWTCQPGFVAVMDRIWLVKRSFATRFAFRHESCMESTSYPGRRLHGGVTSAATDSGRGYDEPRSQLDGERLNVRRERSGARGSTEPGQVE